MISNGLLTHVKCTRHAQHIDQQQHQQQRRRTYIGPIHKTKQNAKRGRTTAQQHVRSSQATQRRIARVQREYDHCLDQLDHKHDEMSKSSKTQQHETVTHAVDDHARVATEQNDTRCPRMHVRHALMKTQCSDRDGSSTSMWCARVEHTTRRTAARNAITARASSHACTKTQFTRHERATHSACAATR